MKTGPLTSRLPSQRAFVRLAGSFSGRTESATALASGVCTVRLRTDAKVTVELHRRRVGPWAVTTYTGRDIQHLLGTLDREQVRLVVIGTASGVAEVVR